MIEEDNENRSLPVTCGACGVAGGSHDPNCPTITDRLSHNHRVHDTIDSINIFHALRTACIAAQPHAGGTSVMLAVHDVLEWATEQEHIYEKRLDDIFPFHRGQK